MTSSSEERVIRMKTAATAVPRARAGKAMMPRLRSGSVHGGTKSTAGAQLSQSETARISMAACQKTGMERLKRLTTRTTWSRAVFSRRAESMPRGTPTASATSMAARVSSTVTWRRLRIIWSTGSPVRQLVPRSPRSTPPIQRRYWTWTGTSRPKNARSARTVSSL